MHAADAGAGDAAKKIKSEVQGVVPDDVSVPQSKIKQRSQDGTRTLPPPTEVSFFE